MSNHTQRRFQNDSKTGDPLVLGADHPAIVNGHTLFLKRVTDPDTMPRLLKSGQNNKKIGRVVVKGKWAGMPLWTLTLQERATCPTTCLQWSNCMGNVMHWPSRIEHGEKLERRLEIELAAMQDKHPAGFVVRLHILGDFYSVGYVEKWASWLARFPALRVYGYTARDPASAIGKAIAALGWERAAIRFSGQPAPRGSIVVDLPEHAPAKSLVCPAQTKRVEGCAECSICWQSEKLIVFLKH